jgi:NAD(P)-dependent dehydrogenase (short-subunit alcohol dehydrogenase family)
MFSKRWLARVGDLLFDPTILLSFDRTGLARHRVRFDPADLEQDLTGRVCVVTGANSGIGYATTEALAAAGATVWMLCRNTERGEAARASIAAKTGSDRVHFAQVDLASLESVRSLAATLPVEKIDVLVQNAGVLPRSWQQSDDGLELTLATNLVGPFALLAGLLERLRAGERPRIIWVSSGGMYSERLDVTTLDSTSEKFDGVAAYARTKRAMVVLSEQLAEKLAPRGIAVHAMHPGWADTPGVQGSIPLFWRVTKAILRTSAEGADTVIWLAACDKAQSQSGLFWFDRQARSTYLLPGKRESEEDRAALWQELHRWSRVPLGRWGE